MIKYFVLNIFLLLHLHVYGQYDFSEKKVQHMGWCTKSLEEQYKCGNLSAAIERDRPLFAEKYLNLTCFRAYSAEECIHHIYNEDAHITTLDAGDVYTAGRDSSMMPIMQEIYDGGLSLYYSVAVIKTGTLSDVHTLRDLRNKRACFPWVGSLAGWVIPMYTLQNQGGMDLIDCNNNVKTAANYFNNSCAVYSLIDKYNPIGDNSDKLCSLCKGEISSGRCTSSDPYYGYDGAFRCLLEAGDVAFLRHSTVSKMLQSKEFQNISPDRFEILCRDGRRLPIIEYLQCNWGTVPSDAIVTSTVRSMKETLKYQEFLKRIANMYSIDFDNNIRYLRNMTGYGRNYQEKSTQDAGFGISNDLNDQYNAGIFSSDRNYAERINGTTTVQREKFNVFESQSYGKMNLLFQDDTRSLAAIAEENQSFTKYLQEAILFINGLRECPIPSMTMCVTSLQEENKCFRMKKALEAQSLKPELMCKKEHSHIKCMQSIQGGNADVAVLDAGDVYTAGYRYNMVPFMSEVYNHNKPEYYVVAVVKEEDPDTEITYLKGKYTCHTGINTAAGWTYPMAFLIVNQLMRPSGCDSVQAAAEFFGKSCVPGVNSNEYIVREPHLNLCGLCYGSVSGTYCKRDASEPFYGHTGAFRCLAEGGGQVAFMKHTTAIENTGGKRKSTWARNTLDVNFELLCPDGTRAKVHDYSKCNLGKVKANAIVTRGGANYNETEINAYMNLLMYAQQLYGRKDVDSFSMFLSKTNYYDLIFQDATQQLQVIPPKERNYKTYLGKDFLRARRITDCFASATQSKVSLLLIITLTAVAPWVMT